MALIKSYVQLSDGVKLRVLSCLREETDTPYYMCVVEYPNGTLFLGYDFPSAHFQWPWEALADGVKTYMDEGDEETAATLESMKHLIKRHKAKGGKLP